MQTASIIGMRHIIIIMIIFFTTLYSAVACMMHDLHAGHPDSGRTNRNTRVDYRNPKVPTWKH